jgi:hypothetical protein
MQTRHVVYASDLLLATQNLTSLINTKLLSFDLDVFFVLKLCASGGFQLHYDDHFRKLPSHLFIKFVNCHCSL